MPTYEYRCKACGHALEIFHSMSDAPKKKCPACGKPKLERQIGTGAGIVFKGSGFYQTDYRSESYKSDQKADTETKPAAQDGDKAPERKADKADKADKKSDTTATSGEAKKPKKPA